MPRAMLFIDGTWLYFNTPRLGRAYGQQEYHLDFGKLPRVLADEVGLQLGADKIDVVRTHLFGSFAANYDPRDNEAVLRRRDFFSMLKEDHHYELETYPVNFLGRRLRRQDRDPNDPFEPKEKCVDIALATSMLYFAAVPHAYDIAIAVLGDQDFKPVLQQVRRLGKQVGIASIRESCSPELSDPRDEARVKDIDMIWLDDMLEKLELKYEKHQLQCEGPAHKGNRFLWTTFHPRRGQKFYCEACRDEFNRQRVEVQNQPSEPQVIPLPALGDRPNANTGVGQAETGVVKKKDQRGYGFVHGAEGDYFFHFTDLDAGLSFEELQESMEVEFDVAKRPIDGRNGTAQHVRRRAQE